MQTWKAEILAKTNLVLGEGAKWHSAWKKFLFVDIRGKSVGTADPVDGTITKVSLNKMPGMVAPTDSDLLIVALEDEIAELDFSTGETKTILLFGSDQVGNRSNDGACDATGRLWFGTMHKEAKLNAGNLYCYDGQLTKKITNTSVSNGLCWSADQKTFYHIDSFCYKITGYDFNLKTGNITNARTIITIEDRTTLPDGMCIDKDGMLWIAMWGGGCVNRYNPDTGQLIGKVEVNAPHVTSCSFGGIDGNQLLITTAKDGLDQEQLETYPDSGSLFMATLDVAGYSASPFTK